MVKEMLDNKNTKHNPIKKHKKKELKNVKIPKIKKLENNIIEINNK
jgi:hypothetical protein